MSDDLPVTTTASGAQSGSLQGGRPAGLASGVTDRSLRAGFALVLLAAALWSLLAVFSTEAQRSGLSPVEVSFWPAGGGALFLIQAIVTRQPRIVARRDVRAGLLRSHRGGPALRGVELRDPISTANDSRSPVSSGLRSS